MHYPEEQPLALECLKLANGDISAAAAMLQFVLGREISSPEPIPAEASETTRQRK